MLIIRDIIQHYPQSDHQDIIQIINGFNEVESKLIIKDIGFVNPNLLLAIEQFKIHYPSVKVKINGGYDKAIRKKVILFPDFYDDVDDNINLYHIKYVNKFQQLSHPQVLGTLLNNGIREQMIGDIIVNDQGIIEVVLDKSLEDGIEFIITKINNLTVNFEKIECIDIEKKENELQVYKAKTLRLDSMLKAILHISRNQCSKLIKSNKVKVNYSTISNTTNIIKSGDVLSIRGYGHFEIEMIKPVNNGYNIYFR